MYLLDTFFRRQYQFQLVSGTNQLVVFFFSFAFKYSNNFCFLCSLPLHAKHLLYQIQRTTTWIFHRPKQHELLYHQKRMEILLILPVLPANGADLTINCSFIPSG